MWYIIVMEYCSAIKNKIVIYATTQMNLKKLCQVKEARAKDRTLYDSICMEFPEKEKFIETENRSVVGWAGSKDRKHDQENFGN